MPIQVRVLDLFDVKDGLNVSGKVMFRQGDRTQPLSGIVHSEPGDTGLTFTMPSEEVVTVDPYTCALNWEQRPVDAE